MTRETFESLAEVYDETLPSHIVAHYLEKRVAYVLANCPRGRGLDVGCGTGMLAARLQDDGYQMSGIDPSEGMLGMLAKREPSVDRVVGSGTRLPFDEDSFDLVVTVAALHHIAAAGAVRQTLGEMVRVCRPGGRLVVWDHNPKNPYWRILMRRVPQDDGSERLIGEPEITEGIRGAGGRVLASDRLGFVPEFVPERVMPAAQRVERAVERSPARRICAHNVILATKDEHGS